MARRRKGSQARQKAPSAAFRPRPDRSPIGFPPERFTEEQRAAWSDLFLAAGGDETLRASDSIAMEAMARLLDRVRRRDFPSDEPASAWRAVLAEYLADFGIEPGAIDY